MKDNIFSDEHIGSAGFLDENEGLKSFAFNSNVAKVFDDMVSRSVPGYEKVQEFTVKFALSFLNSHSRVYDLGSATGTTLIKLAAAHVSCAKSEANPELIGIDSSEDMIIRCREKVNALSLSNIIRLEVERVENVKLSGADLVISLYTLQFLQPAIRLSVLKNIFNGLKPGGYLILAEKIKHSDAHLQEFMTEEYYAFKKLNGYSEAEISRKREALENVLIPFTIEENVELLRKAGFLNVDTVYSDLVFSTMIAKK